MYIYTTYLHNIFTYNNLLKGNQLVTDLSNYEFYYHHWKDGEKGFPADFPKHISACVI